MVSARVRFSSLLAEHFRWSLNLNPHPNTYHLLPATYDLSSSSGGGARLNQTLKFAELQTVVLDEF